MSDRGTQDGASTSGVDVPNIGYIGLCAAPGHIVRAGEAGQVELSTMDINA